MKILGIVKKHPGSSPGRGSITTQKAEHAGKAICGSGLAREGITSTCLTDRVARIAGKPAPTVFRCD
ncbi:hypothetical protein AA303_14850 [Pseudomonas psychrophila]|nr:hypothetical protein AA303_14850 [Pseudomonas psychrophila]